MRCAKIRFDGNGGWCEVGGDNPLVVRPHDTIQTIIAEKPGLSVDEVLGLMKGKIE
jgi:hypothetical protein